MLIHFADKTSRPEIVSALCYDTPHALPRGSGWTGNPRYVTCKRCAAILARQKEEAARETTDLP